MKKIYIGITIGPIVKTLMLTTTPAGLWGASYIFSYYTKNLIKQIKQELKISDDCFIVPVNTGKVENIIKDCPWAGLFHDRIIFQADHSITLSKVHQCIEKVKKDLAEEISKICFMGEEEIEKSKKFIKDYLQVHVTEKEVENGKNPILALSPNLDILELGQSYIPKEDKNYLLDFLENRNSLEQKRPKNRNQNIKRFIQKIEKAQQSTKWHFFKGEEIITIDDIAGVGKDKIDVNTQTQNYFALIKADGDNLGKVLKSMEDIEGNQVIEGIKGFSEKCFDYAKIAFEEVEKYGGKMIYAGGDDLLFIAPVKNHEETIFHLLSTLNDEFINCFDGFSFKEEGQEKKMGFSAGIMICYYKYPLKEALIGALDQLDKSKEIKTKNTISVHFEKHSGKQHGIQFRDFFKNGEKNKIYARFLDLLEEYGKQNTQFDNSKDFLRSVGTKLKNYQNVFLVAMVKDVDEKNNYLKEVFKNIFEEYLGIFDETKSKEEKDEEANYIEMICDLLGEIFYAKLSLIQDKTEKIKQQVALDSLQEIETIIGLLKFYNEKEIK